MKKNKNATSKNYIIHLQLSVNTLSETLTGQNLEVLDHIAVIRHQKLQFLTWATRWPPSTAALRDQAALQVEQMCVLVCNHF